MTSNLTEFSRVLTAHGLGPTGQVAVVVLVCLWFVLAALKRRGVAGPGAESLAIREAGLMVATVSLVILVALLVSLGIQAASRWIRGRAALRMSEAWKREKDRVDAAEREGK